jgi:hypothetical protein
MFIAECFPYIIDGHGQHSITIAAAAAAAGGDGTYL